MCTHLWCEEEWWWWWEDFLDFFFFSRFLRFRFTSSSEELELDEDEEEDESRLRDFFFFLSFSNFSFSARGFSAWVRQKTKSDEVKIKLQNYEILKGKLKTQRVPTGAPSSVPAGFSPFLFMLLTELPGIKSCRIPKAFLAFSFFCSWAIDNSWLSLTLYWEIRIKVKLSKSFNQSNE